MVFDDATWRAVASNHILQRRLTPVLQRACLPAIRSHDVPVTAVARPLRHSTTGKRMK
jgi:hypothetical protein